ncbi:hypothetical protein HDU96_000564 [Phlyctochytrium bullatum]|nr:hypothetical protein HDU96_000564 [Phlyctochytrium bullatum]
MHRSTIAAIAIIAASSAVSAQNSLYPGSTCGSLLATFNTCVDNALVDVTTQTYPSVEEFCRGKGNNQQEYYSCLCTKFQAIYFCYTSSCPNDPNAVRVTQSITQYCAAAGLTSTTAARPATASSSAAVVATSAASVTLTGGPTHPPPGAATSAAAAGTTSAASPAASASTAAAAAATTSTKSGAVHAVSGTGFLAAVAAVVAAAFAF